MKPGAIRSRIQRKTLRVRPSKQANDGLVRVWITEPTAAPISEFLTKIAALRERIGRHEGTEAELRARLADRDRERDRLETDLVVERQHSRDLAGRLDQLHERHRAELDALRAERSRPWWRRVRRR